MILMKHKSSSQTNKFFPFPNLNSSSNLFVAVYTRNQCLPKRTRAHERAARGDRKTPLVRLSGIPQTHVTHHIIEP